MKRYRDSDDDGDGDGGYRDGDGNGGSIGQLPGYTYVSILIDETNRNH